MSIKVLFSGALVAGLFASTTASAHVSIGSGLAAADKSQKITFNIGHGCEDSGGNHYDTQKVRIEIPAQLTGVRALFSDFGKPTLTKVSGQVTQIEWTKPVTDTLDGDDAFYEITIRARVANAPFTQIPITVHQDCDANGTPITSSWDQPEGSTTGNPAPVLTIVPARLNPIGWNKLTLAAAVPADKLGTYFGDAQIVWRGTEAFSTNSHTAAQIAATSGVTALSGGLAAGDEIWVRY